MEQMNLFYNTVNLNGTDLKKAVQKSNRQSDRVLKIFKMNAIPMTPAQVSGYYDDLYSPSPLTSIRRAITNLTKDGRLIKTDVKVPGIYGTPNYKWKLA